MNIRMTILSQGYNEFYNKCHDDLGRFCGENFSGNDVQWSQYSENGKRRLADEKAGKQFKSLPNARFNNELDDAEEWPEKWITDKERKSGKFAVPTFLKGERGLKDPVSYDKAVREHNLAEITRKGANGKEYLAPDTNHITARLKVIGLDKIISPKELSRMVREEKPVWVDEESANGWRFYKVPKASTEIGVGVAKDGTIGTVIPGGYLAMAIQSSGASHEASSQLGRLLMRKQITHRYPTNETATPTVNIPTITIGKTKFRRP